MMTQWQAMAEIAHDICGAVIAVGIAWSIAWFLRGVCK